MVALESKVKNNLFTLFSCSSFAQSTLLLALSGGADSVTLAYIVHQLALQKNWDLVFVHVDHALRLQSKDDAKFVQNFAKELNRRCVVRRVNVKLLARRGKLSIEQAARQLRYEVLSDVAQQFRANKILVAHHAQDSAETFFLNLLRGSGALGLSGIKSMRSLSDLTARQRDKNVQILRPMLNVNKQEILSYIKKNRLKFVEDNTNFDSVYRRNFLRNQIFPQLQNLQVAFVEKLNQSAQIFARQQDFLDSQLQKINKFNFSSQNKLELRVFFRYHIALRDFFLHQLFPQASYVQIQMAQNFLQSCYDQKQHYVSAEKLKQVIFGKTALQQNFKSYVLKFPGTVQLPDWKLKLRARLVNFKTVRTKLKRVDFAFIDAEKLGDAPFEFTLRSWRVADRFVPFGMTSRKKLQDFFVDQKISQDLRNKVPILTFKNKIVWLAGMRLDAEFGVSSQTKKILQIQILEN